MSATSPETLAETCQSQNSDGKRLKRCVLLSNEKAATRTGYVGLENVESWTGKWQQTISTEDSDDGDARAFRRGDVLFGKLRPYLAKCFLAEYDGCCSSEFLVLRPRYHIGRFLQYALLNSDFIKAVDGSTFGAKMPRANWDFIGDLMVPSPNRRNQKAIANFLDRKTAAIDALIAQKRRLVDLLAEKRAALINQAVTRGLDPNIPMKDSGIPWAGNTPAHWGEVRLAFLGNVGQGNAFAHAIQGGISGELPWFKVADMNRPGNETYMLSADNYVTRAIASQARANIFPPGAVIFPRVGAALLTNKRRMLSRPSVVDDNTYAIVPNQRILPRFLYLYLTLIDMSALASPGLVPTITFSAVKDLQIALPPLFEQEAIIDAVDTATKKLDATINATTQSTERLQEYRQALITAAVTGQLEIPVTEPEEVMV